RQLKGFAVAPSSGSAEKSAWILPDLAPCAECLRELFDSANRRFRYPFINCTACGPRFSIIEALPYDRENTTMKGFRMCPECAREYHDPASRRFHAQPNACANCGPQLELWNPNGQTVAFGEEALLLAAAEIRAGRIVALKGVGGFQLLADARNAEAVGELRARKRREEKPFAVLAQSLAAVKEFCEIKHEDERLLASSAAPIVLARKKRQVETGVLADSVAPGNPRLGAMLPASPLHHLLARELGFPVVATSGNLSEEPICTDGPEALNRLRGIADFFLTHDRPIARHVDDSITQVALGREMILRRARGYAPLPVRFASDSPVMLAVGGHLKNSVALALDGKAFISQHIGSLETEQAVSAFRKTAADLPRLYAAEPALVAHDSHPHYFSTEYAAELGMQAVPVPHHYAHVLSCLADNDVSEAVLGVCWDGTGYGGDGTIWGGEFLMVSESGFSRFAHLRQFRLPGSETAVRQPRRSAAGLLHEIFQDRLFEDEEMAARLREFSPVEIGILRRMLQRKLNCPVTSSAGRLFDAVSALLGLRQRTTFEGQAAMDLEFAADGEEKESYAFLLETGAPRVLDWEPMIRSILSDLTRSVPVPRIAARFHNTLAEAIVSVARAAGESRVALTGGCFQNTLLLKRAVKRLEADGFEPFWHRRVPPNDGGLALGQLAAAARHHSQAVAIPSVKKTVPATNTVILTPVPALIRKEQI
ncbi:MAG TPA: carbamoyltransferase HypF, partial [Verrucomicrobiae bacterium]|nr:carbamoyltransferase HypF [Verrucomicrobiae bacterium]